MSGSRIDLTGQKFGRLTVLNFASYDKKAHIAKWKCLCDCGKVTEVRTCHLRSSHTQSCGCLRDDKTSARSKTHGKKYTRLYSIWCAMRQRCGNRNCINYYLYGGRGIKVCESWDNDFIVFYEWAMNNGYADNLTIDRIDSNGNYEPSNCRWSNMQTQQNNKRNNAFITVNGETHTLAEWGRMKSLKRDVIRSRIKRGWEPEEAVLGVRR